MNAALEINGKMFVPVKQAAEYFNYSRDHLTRLAKAKKVEAVQQGRLWYVSESSVKNYLDDQRSEAEVRKQMLRKQRQVELRLHSAVGIASDSHLKVSQKSGQLTVVLTCLFFGVLLATASQIVPTKVVSVASVASSIQTESVNPTSNVRVTEPVFTYEDKVLVSDTNRWVEKPEVTPQWVQISP